jgi:hypothetical protein
MSSAPPSASTTTIIQNIHAPVYGNVAAGNIYIAAQAKAVEFSEFMLMDPTEVGARLAGATAEYSAVRRRWLFGWPNQLLAAWIAVLLTFVVLLVSSLFEPMPLLTQWMIGWMALIAAVTVAVFYVNDMKRRPLYERMAELQQDIAACRAALVRSP